MAKKQTPEQIESIASVCNAAHQQQRVLAGDNSVPAWSDSDQAHKDAVMKRVKACTTKGKEKDKLFSAIVNALK